MAGLDKRRERPLIKMLLSQLDNGVWGRASLDWVEDRERREVSVDVVATGKGGKTLALEHTLVEPFVGEKFDTVAFKGAFGRIEGHPGLIRPERILTVAVPFRAIPRGYSFEEVGAAVLDWLLAQHLGAPEGTQQRFAVPLGCCGGRTPLQLEVLLHARAVPGDPGRCYLARCVMPDSLREVVRSALARKVPKLAATPADKRILLLERDQLCFSELDVYGHIAALAPEFPGLAAVDEVWFADTGDMEPQGWTYFDLVDGRGVLEQLAFRGVVLESRRDDRVLLGPPPRGF